MSGHPAVLITGASSGIGQACARHLCERGYRVYGTSRRAGAAALPLQPPDPGSGCLQMIPMDVTDEASVQRGVAAICECEGRLDAVVNNAGIGISGAVEDTTLAEAQMQFDTNFFGVLRVCRAALPVMRRQRAGTIVNISSMAGLVGVPFQALYSASKHAVEGLTESLRMEVRSYGIHVVLIEPGDFHTGFTEHRRPVAASATSDYRDVCRRAVAVMEADETHGADPNRVARLLERVLNSRSPNLRYLVGPAIEKLAVTGKKLLPYPLLEWVVMKYYRVI